MAVYVSDFAARSTAGSQSVTGVGFQPVAVLFYAVELNQANPSNFLGAADAAGNQWVMWTGMDDQASGYNNRFREIRNDQCIRIMASPSFSSEQCAASITSLDSDGFTLSFSTGGNSEEIAFVAIGGLNITDATVGTFSAGASTGTTAVTGVGFVPTALVVAHTMQGSANTQDGSMAWGLGVADNALTQYSSWAWGVAGVATGAEHIHRTDRIACGSVSANDYMAQLDSMDSDGFTVDVTAAFGSSFVHGYLAIESAIAVAGNAVVPDSTGTQSYTTAGFEPGGVLFCWNGADSPSTTGSTTGPVRPGVGAMDGVTVISPVKNDSNAISLIHRASAPFGAYVPDAYQSQSAILIKGEGSQVDPTPHADQGVAEWDAFAPGSFDLNWTGVTSAFNGAFGWLALPGDIIAPWIPRLYRRGPRG